MNTLHTCPLPILLYYELAFTFYAVYMKSIVRALSLLDQYAPSLCMPHIKQIQAHLTVSGTLFDPYGSGRVITSCVVSNHGDLHHAYQLFVCLPYRNTFVWNTMIRGFVEKSKPHKALSLYTTMLDNGVLPNNYTFSFLLKACAELSALSTGLMLHAQVVTLGWESYDFVQNGLIHLYVTCNSMDSARGLFDVSVNKDVVTWTALINGYAKSRQVLIARKLFDRMPVKNPVSWSAMISGYVQEGLFREALEVFSDMLASGFEPNHAGIVSALTACAHLGALDQGKWLHAFVDRNNLELDTVLGPALIDMYAKCGCIEAAQCVFDKMPDREVFAFTALISGLANHDRAASALRLFNRMVKEGIRPNEVTFVCVLSACGRMGLVDEGLKIFNSMRNIHGIEPGVKHYGCLVDLLGKAGMVEEAKKISLEMPMEPDSYVIGALLNAYRVHGDVELARDTTNLFFKQRLNHAGIHTLISNMFASSDQWNDVARIRMGMRDKKATKVPGCSLVEVDGIVYEFLAGESSHALTGNTLSLCIDIHKHLTSLGLADGDNDKLVEGGL